MWMFSDPRDFHQLKLGLCLLPKPLHEYACTLSLNSYPVLLFGEILLWERSLVFSLLVASNKSLLLLLFGLVVSFGSIPTKRRTQFSGNSPAFSHWPASPVCLISINGPTILPIILGSLLLLYSHNQSLAKFYRCSFWEICGSPTLPFLLPPPLQKGLITSPLNHLHSLSQVWLFFFLPSFPSSLSPYLFLSFNKYLLNTYYVPGTNIYWTPTNVRH